MRASSDLGELPADWAPELLGPRADVLAAIGSCVPAEDASLALNFRVEEPKDVVDYVCPGVLTPILATDVPNSAELLVQFIFGSAAHQIGNPSDKGKVVPGQVAGMRSMLKAYRAFLVADPAARIPRLDELTQMNAAGTLPEYLEPIVVKECGQGS